MILKMSCSKDILNDLKLNYTKLGSPIAYAGLDKIYNHYQKKISKEKIAKFLASVYSYTIHKQVRTGKKNPMYKYYKRYMWEADLIQITNVKEHNNNFSYIFLCIDNYTRFCWGRLLKNKSGYETLQAFKNILSTVEKKPERLLADKGGEIRNKKFETYCMSENIKLIKNETSFKAPHVERLARTLENRIYKYISEVGSFKFYDKLQLFIKSYNNAHHRMIDMTPTQAESDTFSEKLAHQNELYLSKFKKKKAKYYVGMPCRIKGEKQTFQKGFHQSFNDEIFKIHSIKTNLPIPLYILESSENPPEIIKGGFYSYEITPVYQDNYRIESVLKERHSGKEKLVKWKGYPNSFNTWIPSSNIQNINV